MRKESQSEGQGRLILVPCPYQGHINPMLQLGKILHSRGFSITIAHTNFNSPDPQSHPDFSFLPIPDGLSDHEISTGDLIHIISTINVNCKLSFQQLLMESHNNNDTFRFSCIIFDELMYFSQSVAANLNLPCITLSTSNFATFLARSALLQLIQEGQIPFQDSRSHEMVPNLEPLRFKDLPIPRSPDLNGFVQLVGEAYINILTTSGVVWNTIDCLEQPACLMQIQHKFGPVPIFPIGPLHKIAPHTSGSLLKEDSSCIQWLDKQSRNSVIFVSLGSIASIGDQKKVEEMAWGLAKSEQPFLWVVRPGSISGSDWIEGLPKGFKDGVGERGCIVKWAPQKEVLAHEAVGGFWSHCGWNSTLESISQGVPMICKPCFGDQRVNARYVSHEWRVGIELEKVEREEIERAVRKLILNDEGKEMRKRAKDLKEKVEVCTRKGGSSHSFLNDLVDLIMSF